MAQGLKQAGQAGRGSAFWRAFTRPRTFLPQEHGGWVLFGVPLLIGSVVGGAWGWRTLAFALAALALFLTRQPLDLALQSLRGRRTRSDLGAIAAWLAIDALVGLLAAAYLLWVEHLWALLLLGAAALAFLALQMWALQTRLYRTAWVEVIGTIGLGLAGAGAFYVARTAWSPAALALWLLPALQGSGGVLYSRWRLQRRRLAARGRDYADLPRSTVVVHHILALILACGIALLGWAPWAVVPLYALLLARVLLGTRPAAQPDRSVMAIGATEGLANLLGAVWLIVAALLYHL